MTFKHRVLQPCPKFLHNRESDLITRDSGIKTEKKKNRAIIAVDEGQKNFKDRR
jgi:hypothetical protein